MENLIAFKTNKEVELSSCKIYFTPSLSGSGDQSPTNIRSIVGKTGAELKKCKNNLYDKTKDTPDYYLNVNGVETYIAPDESYQRSWWKLSDYIPVVGGGYITYTGIINAGNAPYAGWYDKDKNWIGSYKPVAKSITSVIAPSNACYIRFSIYANKPIPDSETFCIDVGVHPDMTYTAYQDETITVNWESEAGIQYSGNIDLVTGVLTIDRAYAEIGEKFNNNSWANVGNKFYINLNIPAFQQSTSLDDQYCNMYPFAEINNSGSGGVTKDKYFYLQRNPSTLAYCRVWVYDTDYTLAQFKALLQEHPLQVTYPIVPQTYQLSSTQVKSFSGVNRLQSNGNGLEIVFNIKPNILEYKRKELFVNPQNVLPSAYIGYDYLETRGNNTRIDTGIAGNDTSLQFIGEAEILTFTSYASLFNNWKSGNYKFWRLILPEKNTYDYLIAGTYYEMSRAIYLGSSHTFEDQNLPFRFTFLLKYQYIEVIDSNGTKYVRDASTTDDGRLENSDNIALGSQSVSMGGDTDGFKSRFYSFKIYKQGKLVRNYKPCVRKSDNKPGFYDLVNQTFNPSIGSKDFIAGND